MRLTVFLSHLAALALLWAFIGRLVIASLPEFRQVLSRGAHRAIRWAAIGCLACFGCVALSQARLQFLPKSDKFIAAKSYDGRPWIRESRIERGRILSRNRGPLATYEISEGKRRKRYPLGEAAAHLLGYNSAKLGKAGLERYFEGHLSGRSGETLAAMWKSFLNNWVRRRPRGRDLVTTIDVELQRYCFAALKGARGACVALVPESGEVLALVSSPSFDPERVEEGNYWEGVLADEAQPLFNRAVRGAYPPGSTFKVVTAAAALEHDKHPGFTCDSRGFRPRRGARRIRDYRGHSHGKIGLAEALEASCNSYFAQLAVSLGEDLMSEGAQRFYFGRDIPWNTAHERLKDELAIARSSFKGSSADALIGPFSEEELAWSAIGQGRVTASPLHMALVAAGIANNGYMPQPKLERSRDSRVLVRVMRKSAARVLTRMMIGVVERGTGEMVRLKDIRVAGKTGTAETSEGRPHSWFIGFAPAQEPRIAFAVIVEHGGGGGGRAASVARGLVEKAAAVGYF